MPAAAVIQAPKSVFSESWQVWCQQPRKYEGAETPLQTTKVTHIWRCNNLFTNPESYQYMKVQKPLYKAPKSPTHEGVTTTLQSTKVTNLWRCNSPFTKPKSQPNLKVWQLLYKVQKSSIHEGATTPSLIILIAKVGKSGASSRGNSSSKKCL